MINMKKITYILPVILLFALSAVAFASSGGGEHGEGGSHIMPYVWQAVNFGILVALLVFVIKKADIAGLLRARTEGIQKSVDDAREAKELAQKALAEVQERLKSKDKEIEEIINASMRSGEKERDRLIEEGQRLSQVLLEQTKTNIEFELKEAREAIKAEAVQLAMEIAEKKIKDKLDEGQQKKLLDEAMGRLEGKN
jgi:F-type H+-transporting ATPase subunit b